MDNKQLDIFWEKVRDILIKEQDDYKRKKMSKGEEVDIWKMNKAISQRKKIKQLNKITNAIILKQFSDTRGMINKFKEDHPEEKVFYI